MFVVVSIEDKLRTAPEAFQRDPEDVLREEIELKYSNKVMVDVGLFVKLLDFTSVGDPYVYPAEGAAHQICVFRMITFRPFMGEILVGVILSCSKEGLVVTMDFFDDILIPPQSLPQPCVFDAKTVKWIWKYEGMDFEMEPGDAIRFKVRSINYTRVTTTGKGHIMATTTSETMAKPSATQPEKGFHEEIGQARRRSQSVDVTLDDKVPAVMQIIGSIDEQGLGNPIWW